MQPRLTYYDFAGSRGEEVRLALTLAGVAFEDIRIARADYPALRPSLPFPHLPMLEMDGLPPLGQTNAILRLIGRLHGLHPEDPYEAVRHDALMEAVEDLRHRIAPSMRLTDPAERRTARQALARDYIPFWGRGVEALIGAGPFAGGARPAVADIKLYMIHRWIAGGGLDDLPGTVLDPFPKLRAAAAAVAAHPAVIAWYAARP
jgi:prostaglandin-H2 D-isomerase / glutathione transferase